MLFLRFSFIAADSGAFRVGLNGKETGAEPIQPDQLVRGDSEALASHGERLYRALFAMADTVEDAAIRDALTVLHHRRDEPTPASPTPVEIAILWASGQEDVQALPWEWLHDGDNFLSAYSDVVITRRVPAALATDNTVIGRPRILFVVGNDLQDRNIRAGAELMGMLRSVQAPGQLALVQTQVVLDATWQRLIDAVAAFRPHVVHLICHGSRQGGNSATVTFDKERDQSKNLTAFDILGIFERAGYIPQVVVVNACDSANMGNSAEAGISLAGDLVAGGSGRRGVIAAVGMVGQTQDDSCRLFTRLFYSYLFASGSGNAERRPDMLLAMAYGRRFGLSNAELLDAPDTPVIFLRENATNAAIHPFIQTWEQDLKGIADQFALGADYPAFCGRFDIFSYYDGLMGEGIDVSSSIGETGSRRFCLGLEVPYPGGKATVAVGDNRITCATGSGIGGSRLLKEIARKAVVDCHVPVLLDKIGLPVISSLDFLKLLGECIDSAAERFGRTLWLTENQSWFGTLIKAIGDAIQSNSPPDSDALFGRKDETGALVWPHILRLAYMAKGENLLDVSFLSIAIEYLLLCLREDIVVERQEAIAKQIEEIDQRPPDPGRIARDLAERNFLLTEHTRTNKTRLVLLVADVHKMGFAAANTLLTAVLSQSGLHNFNQLSFGAKGSGRLLPAAAQVTRTILLYANTPGSEDQKETVQRLQNGEDRTRIYPVSLRELGSNAGECRADYSTYLLYLRRRSAPAPYVINSRALPAKIDGLFIALHNQIGGLPALMEPVGGPIIAALIDTGYDCLRPATDDDWMTKNAGNGPRL